MKSMVQKVYRRSHSFVVENMFYEKEVPESQNNLDDHLSHDDLTCDNAVFLQLMLTCDSWGR